MLYGKQGKKNERLGMLRYVASVLILILIISSPIVSFCKQPIDSIQFKEVQFIKFRGNNSLESSKLKALMDTKDKSLLHPLRKTYLDEDVLKDDIKRLERFYHSEGFYDVKIKYTEEELGHQKVNILISIDEGAPVIITKITLFIQDPPEKKWQDEISKLIPLKEGRRFRTEDYKDCEKVVLRYLSEKGYPKAKIETIARVFKAERKAFVWIDVYPGKKCNFGEISIEGLEGLDPKEVKRLLTFKTGETFKASKIRESQRRLFDSQLFSFVDISVEGLEGEETELPIRIKLREAKPYTVKLGVGYGTEDKLRGVVEFESRRFMGDARKLRVKAKGSVITQSLETQFIQPHFLKDSQWLEWRTGVSQDDQESFKTKTLYSILQLNIPVSSNLRFFIGPNVEANKLTDIKVFPNNLEIEDRKKENYFISSTVFGFSKDHLDDAINPSKGFRLLNTNEWASESIASDISYLKSDLEIRTYVPIYSVILANRFRVGIISNVESGENIPIFKRFFAGGSNSIRGYPYNKLGPLDDRGNPLGGKTVMEVNTDFRFPLNFIKEHFEGVIFFDFGRVSPSEEKLFALDFQYGIGAGVRYNTVIGPLRLDFGYALNPPEGEQPFQVYFSIGQAF